MTVPAPFDRPTKRRLVLARIAIFWERLWPALWPTVGVAGAFAALALFEFWQRLPLWAHLGAVVSVVAAVGALLIRTILRFRVPTEDDARRRLEIKGGLAHRPLIAMQDTQAGGADDPGARALWALHVARMAELAKGQRVGWPLAGLARTDRDPYALRAALLLVLAIGLVGAGTDAPGRLRDALLPRAGALAMPATAVDGWISPPAYTALAPIFLARDRINPLDPVRVPVGSKLLLQVFGGRGAAELAIDGTRRPLKAIDAANHQIEAEIVDANRIAVLQGEREIVSWPVSIIPDERPKIEFARPPAASQRATLRLEYEASDDYGLTAAKAQIWRAETAGADGIIELDLPVPGVRPKKARDASFHDLTAHPFAGLPVIVELNARDDLDQVGLSEQVEIVLPERTFQHPVARALIEQRKALTTNPEKRRTVAVFLDVLTQQPERYGGDIVAHLLMRFARERLFNTRADNAIPESQELLWDAALRIEEGTLSTAERDLRRAWDALADALNRDAPDEEIERLIAELKDALERYLQALAENALANRDQQRQPLDRNARTLTQNDLNRMLDRLRDMARSGAKQQARDLLNQLREMMENLRAAEQGMAGDQGDGQGGQNALRELGDLMRRQQQLLDRTFRQSQRGQQPGQRGQRGQRQPGQQGQSGEPGEGEGDDDSDGLAGDQGGIRESLNDLIRRLLQQGGSLPGSLARAERAMSEAQQALRQGDPSGAVNPESQALDQMRLGAESIMRELMEQAGENGPDGEPRASDRAMRQADPFGRDLNAVNGIGSQEDVGIPEAADMQRARDILQELHRRASQPDRPKIERDYIERLLKRF
jgi:uncharacterized protein (TIGR02302 family)